MNPRVMKVLALIIVAMALTSCATIKGYPNRTTNAKAELLLLNKYLVTEAITKYESANDSERDGLSKRAWRNEVINARVREADIQFNKFQQILFEEGVGFGLATDWIVLALNAVGAVSSGGVAKVLSATSAAVVGGKAAFDKNAYFEKTMPALVATMMAKRKDVLVRIREGLTKDIDEYSLYLALGDVDTYYNVGTIPGAIVEIAEAAGATGKNADRKLESLTHEHSVKAVPAELQSRRVEAASYARGLRQDNLKLLAKSLGILSDDPLPDILEKISKAQSTDAFNAISQKIKILFEKNL